MIRWLLLMILLWSVPAVAQTPAQPPTIVQDSRDVTVEWAVAEAASYRVFMLDVPQRIVVDVEAEVLPLRNDAAAELPDGVAGWRIMRLRPEWTRMIIDLASPMAVETASLTGGTVSLQLIRTDARSFADRAGVPPDPGWDAVTGFDPVIAAALADSTDFIVVIDPAHGGADRGARAGGVDAADLTLVLAAELAAQLALLPNVTALLTRQSDTQVSDTDRLRFAAEAGADLLIAVQVGLGKSTSGSGIIVSAQEPTTDAPDDSVVGGLLDDLARDQTGPEGLRISSAISAALGRAGVPMGQGVAVPSAFVPVDAGYPTVLLHLGNLADADLRAYLAAATGRQTVIEAVIETVELLAR